MGTRGSALEVNYVVSSLSFCPANERGRIRTLKTKNIMTNETWLASKLYSTHPDDSHLRVVIRDRAPLGYGKGYVVHTYNAFQKGYGNGDYCETWQEAIAYFNKRGSNR